MCGCKCKCAVCDLAAAGLTPEEAIDRVREREAEQMAARGWVAHHVAPDPDSPTGVNYHTHGLAETFGHPDIQIVLPMTPAVTHGVASRVVELIEGGARFPPGDESDVVLKKGYRVRFVGATECGREVLRVILPDKDGRLDAEFADPEYAKQYDDPKGSDGR